MELPPHVSIAPKDDQNKRYALTISAYTILLALAMLVFYVKDNTIPRDISPYEFVLLSLACFRLIRLFTYDQIMRVVRDMFLEKREFIDEHGQVMVMRTRVLYGGRRSLTDLLSCPWCMGMWVSFFLVFLYFLFPPIKYVVLVLALAGVGSAFQIVMNGVGAKAEYFKRENNIHN